MCSMDLPLHQLCDGGLYPIRGSTRPRSRLAPSTSRSPSDACRTTRSSRDAVDDQDDEPRAESVTAACDRRASRWPAVVDANDTKAVRALLTLMTASVRFVTFKALRMAVTWFFTV